MTSRVLLGYLIIVTGNKRYFTFTGGMIIVSALAISRHFSGFLRIILTNRTLKNFGVYRFVSRAPFRRSRDRR